jgi:hypothetical protein
VSWISRDKAWGIHAKRFDKKFHGGNYADLAEAVAAVEELRMYLQSKTREEIGRMKSGRIYL